MTDGNIGFNISTNASQSEAEIGKVVNRIKQLEQSIRGLVETATKIDPNFNLKGLGGSLKDLQRIKQVNRALEEQVSLQNKLARDIGDTRNRRSGLGRLGLNQNVSGRGVQEAINTAFGLGDSRTRSQIQADYKRREREFEQLWGKMLRDAEATQGRLAREMQNRVRFNRTLPSESIANMILPKPSASDRTAMQRRLEDAFRLGTDGLSQRNLIESLGQGTRRVTGDQINRALGIDRIADQTREQRLKTEREYEKLFNSVNAYTNRISEQMRRLRSTREGTAGARAAGGESTQVQAQNRLARTAQLIDVQRLRLAEARTRAEGKVTENILRQEGRLEALKNSYKGIKTELDRITRELQKQQRLQNQNTRGANNQRQTQQGNLAGGLSGNEVFDNRFEVLFSRGGANLFALNAALYAMYSTMNLLTQGFAYLRNFTVQLDREFAQLQAITGTTNNSMVQLRDTVVDVSEQTKFTALEVAEAATVLGQAGFSTQQISESLEDITLLATAVGTDLRTAVDLATSVLGIFNMTASDMGTVTNVITEAVNNTKLSMDKLTLGVQYAANIAAQSNVNFQELTATMGAMANAGIRSGSTMGTGLRQLMIDLQTPTENFQSKLEALGLSMESINVRSQGLSGVLRNLQEAGFTSADAFEVFEVRAAAAFSAISNQIDTVSELRQRFEVTNAAAEANAVQMDSIANKLARLTSQIGTTFTAAIGPTVEVLKNLLDGLSAVFDVLGDMPGVTTAFVTGLTAMTVGITAFFAASLVRGGFSLLASQIAGVGVVTATTSNSVRALTAAMAINAAAGNAAGVATVGFAGAVRGLGAALRFLVATPLGLAVTAMAGFTGVMLTTNREADKLADELDQLETAADSSEQAFNSHQEIVDTLGDEISRLIERSAALAESTDETRIAALEASDAFGRYGLDLNGVEEDINGVIDRMIELQRRMRERSPVLLQQSLVDAQALEVGARDVALNSQQTGVNRVGGLFSPLRRFLNLEGSENVFDEAQWGEYVEFNRLINDFREATESGELIDNVQLDRASQLALNLRSLFEDLEERTTGSNEDRNFNNLRSEIITALTTIDEQLRTVGVDVISAMSAAQNVGFIQDDFNASVRAREVDQLFQEQTGTDFLGRMTQIDRATTEAMTRIESVGGDIVEQYQTATEEFDTLTGYYDDLEETLRELAGEGEIAERAIRPMIIGIQQGRSELSNRRVDLRELFMEQIEEDNERLQAALEFDIGQLESGIEAARAAGETSRVDDLTADLRPLLEQQAQAQRDALLIGEGIDPSNTSELAEASDRTVAFINQGIREITADLEAAMAALMRGNVEAAINLIAETTAGQISAITRQITQLNRELEQSSTPAQAQTVGAEIMDLMEQRRLLRVNAATQAGVRGPTVSLDNQVADINSEAAEETRSAREQIDGQLFSLLQLRTESLIEGMQVANDNANEVLSTQGYTVEAIDRALGELMNNAMQEHVARLQQIVANPELTQAETQARIQTEMARFNQYMTETAERGVEATSRAVVDALNSEIVDLEDDLEDINAQAGTSRNVPELIGMMNEAVAVQDEVFENRLEAFREANQELAEINPRQFDAEIARIEREARRARATIIQNFVQLIQQVVQAVVDIANETEQLRNQNIIDRVNLSDNPTATQQQSAIDARRRIIEAQNTEVLDRIPAGPLRDARAEALNDAMEIELEGMRNSFQDAGGSADDLVDRFDRLGFQMEQSSRALEAARARFDAASFEAEQPLNRFNAEREFYDSPSQAGNFGSLTGALLDQEEYDLETDALRQRLQAYPDLIDAVNERLGHLREAEEFYRAEIENTSPTLDRYHELQRERFSVEDDMADLQRELIQLEAEREDGVARLGARMGETAREQYTFSQYMGQAMQEMREESGAGMSFGESFAEGFKESVRSAKGAFSGFVKDVASGTKSIGEAFRDMAATIIESMLEIAAERAAMAIFDQTLGNLEMFGGGGKGDKNATSSAASVYQHGGPSMGVYGQGANDGGLIRRRYASGAYIPTRDSVPAMLRPGEYVMRNSAVEAIGRENLDMMNAMGNRRISNSLNSIPANENEKEGGGVVNVWVVPPDEKPQMGPKDIVAVISDDIARGGSTKKLIKQIQMG